MGMGDFGIIWLSAARQGLRGRVGMRGCLGVGVPIGERLTGPGEVWVAERDPAVCDNVIL